MELSNAVAALGHTRSRLLRNLHDVQQSLVHFRQHWERLRTNTTAIATGRQEKGRKPLTPREIEVVVMMCEGLQIKEIAAKLKVSPKTVEFHRRQISERMGLTTTASVVRYAIRAGFIKP